MNTESVKSLGWTSLAIALTAIALSRMSGNAQQSPSPSPIIVERVGGDRHQIECLVSSMDDVVTEGIIIAAGETVCSSRDKISELEYRKQSLTAAIATPPPKAEFIPLQLPPADFSAEENAVAIARAKLAQLENSPPQELNFYNPEDSRIYEPGIFDRYTRYQAEIAQARYDVAQAIADLNAAKAAHQRHEFEIQQENNIRQTETIYQQQEQQQEWSKNQMQLSAELAKVNTELESAPRIVTPYAGKVSRVRVIDQSPEGIKVQVTIQKNDND